MHYNHFTISYIQTVQECLNIYPDSYGTITVMPEEITDQQLVNLTQKLDEIWPNSASAVEVLRTKKEAQRQTCLFGLVNDFDLALKTGFLIADRIVLLDYLYERLLKRKKPGSINRTHLSVVVWGVISCLELAKEGKIVIVPHPLSWHSETKYLFSNIGEIVELSPEVMSLLSVLSISKPCNLQPYTIAESTEEFDDIIDSRINLTDAIGKYGGNKAYRSILGSLMSEKLIKNTKFNVILDLPLTSYSMIISSKADFYDKYLNRLTLETDINIDEAVVKLSKNLEKDILETDTKVTKSLNEAFGNTTGLIGNGVAILVAMSELDPRIKIAGAVIGLVSKLSSLYKPAEMEDKTIIAVFKKLHKERETISIVNRH